MDILAGLGKGDLSGNVSGLANLAIQMRKMDRDDQNQALRTGLDIQRLGMEGERLQVDKDVATQNIAVSKAALAKAELENRKAQEEYQRGLQEIDLSKHPLIQNHVLPGDTDELFRAMESSGLPVSKDRKMKVRDIESKLPAFLASPELQGLVNKNWTTRVEVAQEEFDGLKAKLEKDKKNTIDPDFMAKYKAAEIKLSEVTKRAGTVNTTMKAIVGQKQISEAIKSLGNADPRRAKFILSTPGVELAMKAGDYEGFIKGTQEADKQWVELEKQQMAKEAHKFGMTENQRAIRDEKRKAEMSRVYDNDRKSILGKYKLTSDQLNKVFETGNAPGGIGISDENVMKINKEMEGARRRFDNRYFKEFQERPLGTRAGFSPQEAKEYNNYLDARKQAVAKYNQTKKQDIMGIIKSMDQMALEKSLINQDDFDVAWGQ